jgi:hypothetical protein
MDFSRTGSSFHRIPAHYFRKEGAGLAVCPQNPAMGDRNRRCLWRFQHDTRVPAQAMGEEIGLALAIQTLCY